MLTVGESRAIETTAEAVMVVCSRFWRQKATALASHERRCLLGL